MPKTNNTYLSDIAVNQLMLTGEQFHVSDQPPQGDLNINIQVSNAHTTSAKSEDGTTYMVQATVGVHVTLTEPKDNPVRVEALVETFVVTSMPTGVTGEQESFRRLRVEAVDAGYEFGRTRIAELAAISPIVHLNLPSIDPEKVVARISQDDHPDKGGDGNHVLDV